MNLFSLFLSISFFIFVNKIKLQMKERIMEIMKLEGMTQQEFAAALEISPASLSNIFNGKTNPTNNHVNAIHKRFPQINISWLMFGEGDMYNSPAPSAAGKDTAPASDSGCLAQNSVDCGTTPTNVANVGAAVPPSGVKEYVKYIEKPERKITEIRIFFDDGTFETFTR